MTEVTTQQQAALAAPSPRYDIVSELLDDYNYEESYDAEDVTTKPALAPAFKELPRPPPRTDSLRDPKAEAIQRMNTKFQLREDDELSISSHGSRNGSFDQTPRARITSRSLSRSGTPPSLKLYVSNGATAHVPPTPMVYPQAKTLPSSIAPGNKDLPPPPPERSVKRKELQAATKGHQHSKSELERNDSFHSQSEGRTSSQDPSETADAAPPVKRKAVPGAGVKKFVSLLELNNGPRGGKPAPAPTSAPRREQELGTIHSTNAVPSKIPVRKEFTGSNQLPLTPPEEKITPSPPSKALVGHGLPSNPRNKQPMSPLHTRGKSSTGFNILKAQRPAPPIPSQMKEVTTPEMTPSPTLRPEIRVDDEISPMKPLPPPREHDRPFSYEGPETQQGSPKQKQQDAKQSEQSAAQTVELSAQTPPSQPAFPLRKASLDPPEPSPSIRPSTAPAPQSTFPSPSPYTLPSTVDAEPTATPPFTPLTQHPIPLRLSLIPLITPSQLHCYTSHANTVWSNNTFQPLGCMVCHLNDKDRKWACSWCQLRVCRGCSDELIGVHGRDLGRLVEAKERKRERDGKKVLMPVVRVNGVDEEGYEDVIDEVYGVRDAVEEEEEMQMERGRGRSMVRVDSRERE